MDKPPISPKKNKLPVIILAVKPTFYYALGVYVLSAALLFPYVVWYADNPDTFMYIDIAGKYSSGDFTHAINGYWSPAISWLLVLAKPFFADEIFAFKILQVLIGFFALYQWHQLVNKYPVEKKIKAILTYFIIPFLLSFSLLNCTPDLLFLALLLTLINIFADGNIFNDKRRSFFAGITGAGLFLTKGFGFPFFIAASVLVLIIDKKKSGKIRWSSLRNCFGVFIVISGIWITILSLHYGAFTISKAASFNQSVEAAPLPGRGNELPILGSGLHAPEPNAYSAWETPGKYLSGKKISVFENSEKYFEVVKRNLLSIYYFDFRNQPGILFLLLLAIFFIRRGFKSPPIERPLLISLLFILLIFSGYSMILVHSRYTWICGLLMVLLSATFILEIFANSKNRIIPSMLLAIILLLSLKRPFKEIMFTSDRDVPIRWFYYAIKQPFKTLNIFYRPDEKLKNTMEYIGDKKLISGNIASIKNKTKERDSYTCALRIARHANAKYFGQLNEDTDRLRLEDELRKHNIDFLLTFGNTSFEGKEIIFSDNPSGLKVFKLK